MIEKINEKLDAIEAAQLGKIEEIQAAAHAEVEAVKAEVTEQIAALEAKRAAHATYAGVAARPAARK